MTLRTQLDDLSAAAPGPDALDLDRLRGRITRRRRGRLAAAGGAALLTVAAVGTAAATLLPGSGGDPTEPPIATPSPVQQAFAAGDCGRPVRTLGPAPDAPLELTVDLHTPEPHGVSEQLGTATVTNVGGEPIVGTTSTGPAVTVVETAGAVVTEPGAYRTVGVPVDLAPGESMTFDVVSFLRQCVPGEPTQPWNETLPPGRYEVYVAWNMTETVRGNSSGNPIHLYSGPIAVDLP